MVFLDRVISEPMARRRLDKRSGASDADASSAGSAPSPGGARSAPGASFAGTGAPGLLTACLLYTSDAADE